MLVRKSRSRRGLRRLGKSARRSDRMRRQASWQLESLEGRLLLASDLQVVQEVDDSWALPNAPITFTANTEGPETVIVKGAIEQPGGTDRFRISAHSTGKLILNAIFDHRLGDLDLAVDDVAGNTIARAESNDDDEQIVIPVVSQQVYFVRVLASDGESTNRYDLEVENFAAPIPTVLRLTPASDTGMLNRDSITADATPDVILQADLADYLAMGVSLLSSPVDASGVPELPRQAGVAVRVSVTNLDTGDLHSGYATPLNDSGTLYEFTLADQELVSGLYVVNAAVETFDGSLLGDENVPVTGRGQLSSPFGLTIDLDPPNGADQPDLLNSSDTGMSMNDNVTSQAQPAFSGIGEPNVKVRIMANRLGVQTEVIGQSVTNPDGSWEITVEPLADDKYAFRAEYEDVAGNVSSIGEPLLAEVDSLKPNTPYLDLMDDTGLDAVDNVTNTDSFLVSMTTTDPRQQKHLNHFNYKYRVFLRADASDPNGDPTEVMIYDSSIDPDIPVVNLLDGLTDLEQLSKTLGPLPDGVHNLKLEVEDRAGNISDDFLLTVAIDTQAPIATVDLIEASDTGVFHDDNVTAKRQPAFSGVSEVNSKISIFANGVLVGTGSVGSDETDGRPGDGQGAWEVTVEPLADGEYDIVAEIEDLAGNRGRSESVTIWMVTTDPHMPFLDLRSDSGIDPLDRITSDNTPDILITAATTAGGGNNSFPRDLRFRVYDRPGDAMGEQLLVDSLSFLGDLTDQGLFVESLPELGDGLHNLRVEVEDRAGNISHAFLLDLEIDTEFPSLPAVSLQSFSDSGTFHDDFVTAIRSPALGGTGSIGDRVSVIANGLLLGSTVVGSDVSDGMVGDGFGAWQIQLDPLRDGEHQIQVQIEDLAGNLTSAEPFFIWVDTTQPNLPLLDLLSDSGHRSDDEVTYDNTPILSVTANDTPAGGENPFPHDVAFRVYDRDGVSEEKLLYDSFVELGGFVAGGFYEIALPELADGSHNLKLEVEDRAGNISHEFLLELEIDTELPGGVTIDLAEYADSGISSLDHVTRIQSPAFLGHGTVGNRVLLFANNELVGEATVHSDDSDGTSDDGIGLWEITVEPLDDGVYSVFARLEDAAGNVNRSTELTVEIDTLEPNTPFLDLWEEFDSGRHNDDNRTYAESLVFSATSSDPHQADHLTLFPDGQNLEYRLYARSESGDELLVYRSSDDAAIDDLLDGLTSKTQLATTPITLPEGLHNLKLEVEDRAGNLSHDFLLPLLVDRTGYRGEVALHPDSDSGINGAFSTFLDGVTRDRTPDFTGRAEANGLVTVTIDGLPAGTTVAVPYDGDEAIQPPHQPFELDGNWSLSTVTPLAEGSHVVEVSYEDPAGNRESSSFDLIVDSVGPKIVNVTQDVEGYPSLFDPKPASGPDPILDRIVIHVSDGPDRAGIDFDAAVSQLLSEEGHYQLVGDANGNMPIARVEVEAEVTATGQLLTQAILVLAEPLPDDRYTLTVADSITDRAGNSLDGESGAASPFEGSPGRTPVAPVFPSGDGVPGGEFVARFTIDSRPELGVWGAGTIWVDTNGNFAFDPENLDFTNRDIVYRAGFTSDEVFAGNFALRPDDLTDGYDKLASYGKFDDTFRWLVDTDNDGVPNIDRRDPNDANGLPVAGRFDANDENGDEVAVFDGQAWYFDTDHDFKTDAIVRSNLTGYPFVGDFDGDGFDDLATWADDQFMIDLADGSLRGWDGFAEHIINFGFIGVRERPVAADMDQDGFDDLGIWVPDRPGVLGRAASEWYFLVSGGESLLNRMSPPDDPVNSWPTIDYTPTPFGNDLFAQFGDEFALPLVGNFDPPTLLLPSQSEEYTNPGNPLDVNDDGHVSPLDALLLINELNNVGAHQIEARIEGVKYPDVNADQSITPIDALLVLNATNASLPLPVPSPRSDVSLTSAMLADQLFADQQAVTDVEQSVFASPILAAMAPSKVAVSHAQDDRLELIEPSLSEGDRRLSPSDLTQLQKLDLALFTDDLGI